MSGSTIDESIEFLQTFASDALGRASALAGRIPTNLVGMPVSAGILNHNVKPFSGAAPPKFSDLLGAGTDTTQATKAFLDHEAEQWIDKYFPELNACLRSTPEEWLCGVITGEKPYGLAPEVFDAVWHSGRDRAYRAAHSQGAQLRAEFSQRGFTLPPGALISALVGAEVRAAEAISEVNRQQLDRNAEIKLDLLKFAEEQAIRLKLGILDALARFYQQWISLPDKDIERLRTQAQMYSALQSALSSFYNVELGFEELRLQAAVAKHGSKVDLDKLRTEQLGYQPKGDAMATAVRGFTDAAAGAANAQSTFAADISTGGTGT